MGLFSRLKNDVTHGGVKIKVQAPSSIASNQVIPVVITITSDNTETITGVLVVLQQQERQQGMSIGMNEMGVNNGMNGMGMNQQRSMYQTVAQVESRDLFVINPGETKTVNLQLFVNGSSGTFNPASSVGGIIGGLINSLGTLNHVNYIYRVEASVSIEGIGTKPKDTQAIELLPPSQPENIPQQPQSPQNPVLN